MWERRLNRRLNSCGCGEGAVGLLGGFSVSLTAALLGWPYALSLAAAVFVVVTTTVGATFAGRLAGKLRGRRRGLREALDLVAQLDARPAQTPGQQVLS